MTIIVGVGVVFELPVIILILSIFGIVTPKFLIKQLRYAVLVTAVAAAAIAPTPDFATLFMLWIPMVGLYIVSIGLSWLVYLAQEAEANKVLRLKRTARRSFLVLIAACVCLGIASLVDTGRTGGLQRRTCLRGS